MTTSTVESNWAVTSFDPWDPRITHDNVWDMYRAMRQAGPVVYSDALGGFWCLTAYAEVRKFAADHKTFSSAARGVLIGKQRDVASIPLEVDRPDHRAYRAALQAPFLASSLRELQDIIHETVSATLDRIADLGKFDVVSDLAEPIPRQAISFILGIKKDQQTEFSRLALARIHAPITLFEAAQRQYYEFFRDEVVESCIRSSDSGFISALLRADINDQRLTPAEVAHIAAGLATAGYATTIHALTSLVYRVARHESERTTLTGPDIADRVVEEALRIDPPIHLEGRTAVVPVVVGETRIPAGDQVALLYASANHDDSVYAQPETFDPRRASVAHLAFGHGIHKCLGAPLARLEMAIVLREMVNRFPGYHLIEEPVSESMAHGHHLGWESIHATTD